MGEKWEVGEKPSTFLGSHERGVGQENTFKGWINMLQRTYNLIDDDYEYDGKWLQISENKMEPTDCANNLVPAQTTPLPSKELNHWLFPPKYSIFLPSLLSLYLVNTADS